jgi:hypothetical protein
MADKANNGLVIEFQRIRNVKPQFFLHEGLFDAEIETKMPIRLAYIGLWTCCDKYGRFEWKPRTLKLKILPHDTVDFAAVLEAFVKLGCVVKYEVDGKPYGYIVNWKKHQYISAKELKVKSQHPAPPGVVDLPETTGEVDLEDVPDLDQSDTEPGRVGTGAVPEPGQGVSIGVGIANGNGKECETVANGNARSKAAQSQPQSHPSHSFSDNQQSQSDNPQSKTNPRPRYLHAEHLARLFYSLLPQENQEAAAAQWERLWSEDLGKLISGPNQIPSMTVADVMLFAHSSRFKKYLVRAAGFVEMFPTIHDAYETAKKKGIRLNITEPDWEDVTRDDMDDL